ncbi:MAG TPA: gliding motility lipoprotein GldH [Flavobacteriales bacterium]|nr:gliding motility lipoprotein GldH [Flavobacteriales bacterium]
MKIILNASLFCLVLASCGKKDFFSEDKAIEGGAWNKNNQLDFTVEVTDTVSFYDFFIDLRHNEFYEFSEIYFFFDIEFPNGKQSTDTIHCMLQNGDKWVGNKSGSIIENHVLIKPKTRFPKAGTYKMHLKHGMRPDILKGIEDVGIAITKRD